MRHSSGRLELARGLEAELAGLRRQLRAVRDRILRELRPARDRALRARHHLVLERRDVVAERREPRHRVDHHLMERDLAGGPRGHRVEAREHRRGGLGLRLGFGLRLGRHLDLLVRPTLRPTFRSVKSDFVHCTNISSSVMTFPYCNARHGRVRRSRMTKRWWQEPTRAQWAAFAAAWVGWVLDAFDFTIYLLVMKHIASEFGQSIAAVSGSITLTLLVRLAGGSVSGWMADRWGRKLPLMISLVWFAVFDASIYFAPSFAWILALRTIFGFGMGAEWTAGTALAMESLPPKSRQMASGLLQAGWPVGFLLAAATACFVVPEFGWRAMFLVAVVPAILVFPIRFLVRDDERPVAKTSKSSPFAGLGARGVPTMLVLGALVTSLGFIVYYGLTSQYSLMLMTDLHFSPQAAFLDVIIFNIGMLVGVVAPGVVASR